MKHEQLRQKHVQFSKLNKHRSSVLAHDVVNWANGAEKPESIQDSDIDHELTMVVTDDHKILEVEACIRDEEHPARYEITEEERLSRQKLLQEIKHLQQNRLKRVLYFLATPAYEHHNVAKLSFVAGFIVVQGCQSGNWGSDCSAGFTEYFGNVIPQVLNSFFGAVISGVAGSTITYRTKQVAGSFWGCVKRCGSSASESVKNAANNVATTVSGAPTRRSATNGNGEEDYLLVESPHPSQRVSSVI